MPFHHILSTSTSSSCLGSNPPLTSDTVYLLRWPWYRLPVHFQCSTWQWQHHCVCHHPIGTATATTAQLRFLLQLPTPALLQVVIPLMATTSAVVKMHQSWHLHQHHWPSCPGNIITNYHTQYWQGEWWCCSCSSNGLQETVTIGAICKTILQVE